LSLFYSSRPRQELVGVVNDHILLLLLAKVTLLALLLLQLLARARASANLFQALSYLNALTALSAVGDD